MPAGVTWGRYLRFFTVSMLTMFAGAQAVHLIYKPLDDMEDLVDQEKQRLTQTSGSPPGKS